jgi:hypothetical protein
MGFIAGLSDLCWRYLAVGQVDLVRFGGTLKIVAIADFVGPSS